MNSPTLNLSNIDLGTTAIVTSVLASENDDVDLLTRRLLELGFIPGTEVQALYEAPLAKDPRSYLVRGMHIALRCDEAARVLVSQESSGHIKTTRVKS